MSGKEFPPEIVAMFRTAIDEMMPAHKLLGITLKDIREGYALLSMPFRPDLVGDPRSNRLHGGIVATILDAAGGAAALTTFTSPNDLLASIDMRVDWLEAGKAEDVVAEGTIVRNGSAIIVTNMKAWHPESGIVIAEGRGVYRVRRNE
jgi:uncharacterized protein (TIGR00369 family)